MFGKNGCFVHCLKTRTPLLWGECYTLYISVLYCVNGQQAFHCHSGCGRGGGLHVGHYGDPCTFTPDSSVMCTQKIAGTLTYENISFYVQNNSAGNRTSIETTTAVKRHAKAQVPTNWTRSRIPPPPLSSLCCRVVGKEEKEAFPSRARFSFSKRERETAAEGTAKTWSLRKLKIKNKNRAGSQIKKTKQREKRKCAENVAVMLLQWYKHPTQMLSR